MSITNRTPLNRNSERVTHDDKGDTLRCYSPSNPHYYISSSGTLEPIDLSYSENITLSTIGDANIARRNIRSVGVRKDGSTNKFLGLRPDENQHLGTEQLEFTIKEIILDGVNQTIDLSTCSGVDTITTDLGSILIRSNRQGTRQLIKAPNIHQNFKIVFDIELTGLEIQNNIVDYTDEIIRSSKNTSQLIEEITTGSGLEIFWDETSSTSDYIHGGYISGVDSIVASPDDVTISGIPSEWVQCPQPNGGNFCESYYTEDDFFVTIFNPTLSKYKIAKLVKDFLENITGGTVVSEDDGVKHRLNLVGIGYIGAWAYYDDKFYFNFSTANHPEADSVWITSQTISGSYDCTYQNIVDEWSSFTSAYGALVNTDEIKVSGTYFEEDMIGKFIITTSGTSDIKFVIDRPKLLNGEFEIVSNDTVHTLELTSSGTLEYTKYSNFRCIQHLSDCAYIDADIYYGTTADGYVLNSVGNNDAAGWFSCRNAATGTSTSTADASAQLGVGCSRYSKPVLSQVIRSFFYFDTSAIAGTVTAAALNIYGITRASTVTAAGVTCQKGTQSSTLVNADYDAFSGSSYDSIASWDQTDYNTFTLNSTGISDVNINGTTKVCCRPLQDYNNELPLLGFGEGMYYADNTGTTKDPYLEITAGGSVGGPYSSSAQRMCFFST